jgi:hypothetical protein
MKIALIQAGINLGKPEANRVYFEEKINAINECESQCCPQKTPKEITT